MQNIGQFLIFFWNIWNKTRDHCTLSARDKSWDGALGAGWKNIGQFLQCRLFYDWPLFCGEINSVLSLLKDYKKAFKIEMFPQIWNLKENFHRHLKKIPLTQWWWEMVNCYKCLLQFASFADAATDRTDWVITKFQLGTETFYIEFEFCTSSTFHADVLLYSTPLCTAAHMVIWF